MVLLLQHMWFCWYLGMRLVVVVPDCSILSSLSARGDWIYDLCYSDSLVSFFFFSLFFFPFPTVRNSIATTPCYSLGHNHHFPIVLRSPHFYVHSCCKEGLNVNFRYGTVISNAMVRKVICRRLFPPQFLLFDTVQYSTVQYMWNNRADGEKKGREEGVHLPPGG